MRIFSLSHRSMYFSLVLIIGTLFAFAATTMTLAANASVTLVKLSTDPYTNTTSQHKTEVEPDNYSNGSTIVSAFQVGRFANGGSSNIGWATSTNGGATWKHGFLPGTTVFATPAGKFGAISDPSVAFDAKHNTWLISALALGTSTDAVLVSQSTNGGLTWSNPVVVQSSTTTQFFDKDWIVCDDTASSPFYGNCYTEWDNANSSDSVLMSTSSNGGSTWGASLHPANANGLGGQPLVQPNGTVIVPFAADANTISAFRSTNGGASWASSTTIATVNNHADGGNLRSPALPSAEIDGSGKVYVVWSDCRFESGCAANDIVMSTSTDGVSWSAVVRIPADAVGSGVDHFVPGIAVDKSTSSSTAHLGLAFYFYPVSNCSAATCQLKVGFVSSTDGGATWTTTMALTGAMKLAWLAQAGGPMVGDYISASFSHGKVYPIFAVAKAPAGSTLNEAMFTVSGGLAAISGTVPATSSGVLSNSHATVTGRKTAY